MYFNKKCISEFFIVLAIVIILFIPWIKEHYATDTYKISYIGYKQAANLSLVDGRIAMSIIGYTGELLKLPIKVYIRVLLIGSLIISSLCVIEIKTIITKIKKEKKLQYEIIALLIAYITIFNFMYIENLYFAECFVMAVSVLLYILSAKEIAINNNYIKSMLFAVLGMFCYQGTIGIFITMTFLFSMIEEKIILKNLVKKMFIMCIELLIAVLLQFICIKTLSIVFAIEQTRMDKFRLFYNIVLVLKILPGLLINSCDLFPKNLQIIYLTLITILVCFYSLIKHKEYIFFEFITIVLISIISGVVIHIASPGSFAAGRIKFTIGAIVGILFIYFYCKTDLFNNTVVFKKLFLLILISYFLINVYNYEFLIFENQKVNINEKKDLKEINKSIEEYEIKNNCQIKKIVKLIDINSDSSKGFYDEIKHKNTLTYCAYRTEWSAEGIIYYYTGRNLETSKINKNEYIDLINDFSNDKDLQFIDDTMYLRIYIY